MAGGAITLQQRFLIMRAARRAIGKLLCDTTVAFNAKLSYLVAFEQSRIC
jgi:hypothetical protein